MKDEALIPLRIFRHRAVTVTVVASVIIGMAMFGAMMMLPLYMQIVHNASPMKSGLMMLPLVAGMMTASITAGQLTARTGRVREFPIIGTAIVTVGMFLLHTISADTPLADRLTPVYPSSAQLPQAYLRKAVASGLDRAELGGSDLHREPVRGGGGGDGGVGRTDPVLHAAATRSRRQWRLGRRQAVRQRFLVPPCGGSNPPSSAIYKLQR